LSGLDEFSEVPNSFNPLNSFNSLNYFLEITVQKSDPRWRKLGQNLLWFVLTMIVLIVLFRFTFMPVVMVALWVVGLVWGGVLAYKLSQILLDSGDVAASQEQAEQWQSQAQSYHTKIKSALKDSADTPGMHSEELTREVDTLVDAIEALVERIHNLRADEVIRQDMKSVPEAIADLESRIADETNPAMQKQLQRTLENRQKQLESLLALENTIERAEIQIESSLSQLGTIYSQLLTGQSTSQVADYSRLAADVDEEVHLLNDQLEALREVKLGGN